jgi:hypothetical protein
MKQVQIIPHACTHEDGTWMDIIPNEVPLGGTESFSIPIAD